jgi:hypothetical protein
MRDTITHGHRKKGRAGWVRSPVRKLLVRILAGVSSETPPESLVTLKSSAASSLSGWPKLEVRERGPARARLCLIACVGSPQIRSSCVTKFCQNLLFSHKCFSSSSYGRAESSGWVLIPGISQPAHNDFFLGKGINTSSPLQLNAVAFAELLVDKHFKSIQEPSQTPSRALFLARFEI